MSWFSQCSFNRPTTFESRTNKITRAAEMLRPIGHTQGLILKSNKFSFVTRLLFGVRPSAIFLKISKVIVDSINRQSNKTWTHISKEIFKFFPRFANSNAPTTIAMIAMMFRIRAGGNHSLPSYKFSRTPTSIFSMAVFGMILSFFATTAFAISTSKSPGAYGNYLSTIAPAFPLVIIQIRNNHQSGKALTSQIFKPRIFWPSLMSKLLAKNQVFILKTATAFRLPTCQGMSGRYQAFSAVTLAKPYGCPVFVDMNKFQNSQPVKALTTKIFAHWRMHD